LYTEYFECSKRESENCPAKKKVIHRSNLGPEVVYLDRHTCVQMISSKTTKSISQQNSLSNDITLAEESENNNNFVSTEDGSFVEKKVCQPL
jgi:hypothetical protein